MRILLVTDWNRGRGGVEAYVSQLAGALTDAGHVTRLLVSSAGSAGDGAADYVAFGTERLAAQSVLQIANPFAVATLRRALADFRPDVAMVNMFAHHLSPALPLGLGRVPLVLSVSDYKCICPVGSKLRPDGERCGDPAGTICLAAGCVGLLHWLRDRPRYALIRSVVRRAARIVACSEHVAAELAAEGIEATVALLPTPAPGPGYERVPARDPTFFFCGRLDAEKGVALLLRAFARVLREAPTARLRIAGRGPLGAELERLARSLDVAAATRFLGWLGPEAVEGELARASALVAPSLWAEPLGLVALEAIVRGVPVVASAEGGFRETVVHGRSGLLVPNGDEDALVRAMAGIASGHAFPQRSLDARVVADMIARHSFERHVSELVPILADARSRCR